MPAINIQFLKAAALISSREETRYYLNGVCVEARENDVNLIATDGHRIIALNDAADWAETQGPEPRFDLERKPFTIIIPLDIIADIKLFKPITHGTLTVAEGGKYLLQYCGRDYLFAPIDGTFPDWRRIVPSEVDGKVAQFNAQYIGDLAKVAKALGDKEGKVFIYHNGHGPAPISFPGVEGVSCVCAVMPIRYGAAPYECPSWAK